MREKRVKEIKNKVPAIIYWGVWIFLLCYFMQFLDFPNVLALLLGGVICLILVLQQKRIRIDVGICLLTLTLVSYYVIINGTSGLFYSILYIPIVIYEIGNYSIGAIKNEKEKSDKVLLLLLALIIGYGIYGILNSYMWYAGYAVPGTRRWQDFWSGEIVPGTQHTAYFLPMMACFLPALIYAKKRKWISAVIITMTAFFGYTSIATRSRMSVLIFAIVVTVQAMLFVLFEREKVGKQLKNKWLWIAGVTLILVFTIVSFLFKDSELINVFIANMGKDGGILKNVRFEAQRLAIQQLFKYPMGGYMMDLGKLSQAHNVWLDMANAAGVIPFLAFVIYTIYTIYEVVCVLRIKWITVEAKLIIMGIYIVFFLYFLIEPALEASIHLVTPWFFLNGLTHGVTTKENQ